MYQLCIPAQDVYSRKLHALNNSNFLSLSLCASLKFGSTEITVFASRSLIRLQLMLVYMAVVAEAWLEPEDPLR